jgi:hypothetical protein
MAYLNAVSYFNFIIFKKFWQRGAPTLLKLIVANNKLGASV